MATRIPLFGAGLQGKSAVVTAQHRLNVYANIEAVEDRTRISFHGTAGLVEVLAFGGDPSRGWLVTGDYLYSVHGYTLYRIDSAFNAVAKGTIGSFDGRVGITTDGRQILIVDGSAGYVYNIDDDVFSTITSVDFPNNSYTCTWQDGYFIFEDGDDWQLSDLDDATSHDATRRASAETIPDTIVRVHADDHILLCGPSNIEFWANAGTYPFPYARLGGGGALKVGLAARWSLTPYRDGVAFLGRTRGGGLRLYALAGGGLQPLSNPEWEALAGGYSNVANATGLAYSYDGHDFYQINIGGKSWLYDGALLNEMSSGGGRHRADMAVEFNDQMLVADYDDGRIYRLDPDVYDDDGEPLIREITSRHLFDQQKITVMDLWFDMETGKGLANGQGSNPQLMLTTSNDSGRTFGNHQWCSTGKIGEYWTRCRFGRQGSAYSHTFRVRQSDPVKFTITGEGFIDGG